MADTLSVQIGRRIRSRREELGLTREKLAERSDLSLNFFAEIETGRNNMSVRSLYKVARALNLSADFILFGEKGLSDHNKIQSMLASLSQKDRELAENILENFVRAIKER